MTEAEFQKAMTWRNGDDTGVSSIAIWAVMVGVDAGGHTDPPRDSDDFGRCFRLLKQFPRWKSRLGEVALRWFHWRAVVARWGDLEKLYVGEDWNGVYELLHAPAKPEKDPREMSAIEVLAEIDDILCLGDKVYNVRNYESSENPSYEWNLWKLPKVKRYGALCNRAAELIKEHRS